MKKINKKKLADVKASHQTKISKGKNITNDDIKDLLDACLLYTSPSPRDRIASRMPSSA